MSARLGHLRSALPSSVRVHETPGGLPYLDVAAAQATARVFFHGAHVAQWTPAHASAPVLWLSAHSHYRDDKAIRGGVPICFPWFSAHPTDATAPAHGFARLRDWAIVDASEAVDGTVTLSFVLDASEHLSPSWPHGCRLTYHVSIGTTLAMRLVVENVTREPLTFEEALHTYFSVSDIARVSVRGLEETEYLDKVEQFARKRQGPDPIRFTGETDRVYLDTTATCSIADPGWSRTIAVSKSGSRTTVVWNPWAEKVRSFPDFGADEWRQMLCVETANVGGAAIRLAPGASHVIGADVSTT